MGMEINVGAYLDDHDPAWEGRAEQTGRSLLGVHPEACGKAEASGALKSQKANASPSAPSDELKAPEELLRKEL